MKSRIACTLVLCSRQVGIIPLCYSHTTSHSLLLVSVLPMLQAAYLLYNIIDMMCAIVCFGITFILSTNCHFCVFVLLGITIKAEL
jgi:ABC-type multidrug transport system permease subunit